VLELQDVEAASEERDDEAPVAMPVVQIEGSAQEWYEKGCDLEESSPAEARTSYLQALELDPEHLDSHLNLGRLLHEARDLKGAERHYRAALEASPRDATAAYNLGVVLEDVGLSKHALEAYERAIESDPSHVDAYSNAVRLHEQAGDKAAAIRLLKTLRALRL